MLSVLMECKDQETELAQTLSVLVAGAVEGLVSDVSVLDRGSQDASSRVADAAGCRFHVDWRLDDVLRATRGEWLLLIEPGARPQIGWIDEVAEHMAMNRQAARFSPSRNHRRSLVARLVTRPAPLEHGLVVQKAEALARTRAGMGLADLARSQTRAFRLVSEMVPAWAARG
ncbi:glycosyl transferase [Rhizobium straminoryzae]|uniref:Glycosyl transferase n=1 Tax=Rhizobium straminoryzae TaxID=1387186 RepID=A0A549TBM7_9HYPH|nr:glycosyl transferase [Rhizobium straminoryzae]TRL39299.1 glycosyl transferase [Rhizobium straminoryzae]